MWWYVMFCALSAEDVVNLASRRLSVSPSCASSNSHRNYSFRRGSVWSVRSVVSAEGKRWHHFHSSSVWWFNKHMGKNIRLNHFWIKWLNAACRENVVLPCFRWWKHHRAHTNTPHAAATPVCFSSVHLCCCFANSAPNGGRRCSRGWCCRCGELTVTWFCRLNVNVDVYSIKQKLLSRAIHISRPYLFFIPCYVQIVYS